MAGIDLPQDTFVVITTGEEAKFFRNHSNSGDIELKNVGSLSPKDLDDDGPAGKRPPESSQQETDEATFSKQLANFLFKLAHSGKFDHLALIADPDTLGELRPILHQEVTDKIVLEHDKTLINAPMDEIERSLKAI